MGPKRVAAVGACLLACAALGCNGDSTTTTNDDAARWAIGIWHLSEQVEKVTEEKVNLLEIFADGRFEARNKYCDGAVEPPFYEGTWSVAGTNVLQVDAEEDGRVRWRNEYYQRIEFRRFSCRALTQTWEQPVGVFNDLSYDLGELCWDPPMDCGGLIDVCDYDALPDCNDDT